MPLLQYSLTPQYGQMAEDGTEVSCPFLAADFSACKLFTPMFSFIFYFVVVVVVQFNNTSNSDHKLNLKKAGVVPKFIFLKNKWDKYPPVFYLGNATEIYNPICCEVKALCIDETQL